MILTCRLRFAAETSPALPGNADLVIGGKTRAAGAKRGRGRPGPYVRTMPETAGCPVCRSALTRSGRMIGCAAGHEWMAANFAAEHTGAAAPDGLQLGRSSQTFSL